MLSCRLCYQMCALAPLRGSRLDDERRLTLAVPGRWSRRSDVLARDRLGASVSFSVTLKAFYLSPTPPPSPLVLDALEKSSTLNGRSVRVEETVRVRSRGGLGVSRPASVRGSRMIQNTCFGIELDSRSSSGRPPESKRRLGRVIHVDGPSNVAEHFGARRWLSPRSTTGRPSGRVRLGDDRCVKIFLREFRLGDVQRFPVDPFDAGPIRAPAHRAQHRQRHHRRRKIETALTLPLMSISLSVDLDHSREQP